MKILEIKEQLNGSAILEVEITDQEKSYLIEYGFNEMLKKSIKEFESELVVEERKCFSCGAVIEKETIKAFPDTEQCGQCINEGVIN